MNFSFFLDAFFPRRCPICLSILPSDKRICPSCRDHITFIQQPFCYRCGKPLSNQEQEYCHDCISHPKSFDRGFSVMLYDKYTQFSMIQFKYHNKREFATFYIEEALRLYRGTLLSLSIQAILPVPIHPKKKKERGYNQAELLANLLSINLKIPVISSFLLRTVYTTPQKELTPKERLLNLSKAFCINQVYTGLSLHTILLVDDIYTTGATLESCTKVLQQAGVKRIYALCICTGFGY